MRHSPEFLRKVGRQFNLPGEMTHCEPYGSGHINDTYRVCWTEQGRQRCYIHQRINHNVFKNPPQLMENIQRVTAHLRKKIAARVGGDPDRETLTVVPTGSGCSFHHDDEGNYWRTYLFINHARTYDVCASPQQAREAARAFAGFQADLADLPGRRLHETIPFFHHTPRRFAALEEAIAKDACNRAKEVRPEIDFCMKHKPLAGIITGLLESGEMPERITHNDTKLNNVLIDDDTGRGVCVIDLDTVMPGCVLYDFGDMVRTFTRTSMEDEPDLQKVNVDLKIFEALTEGYLSAARAFLAPVEIRHMAIAGQLITFTIGIRFLTDYLQGDVYFKTHRPRHNLDRARVQFKMVADMEHLHDRLQKIVEKYA